MKKKHTSRYEFVSSLSGENRNKKKAQQLAIERGTGAGTGVFSAAIAVKQERKGEHWGKQSW